MDEQNMLGWKMWERSFRNAKKFFDSKGNIETKSRLKDKWNNEFFSDLNEIGHFLLNDQDAHKNEQGGKK